MSVDERLRDAFRSSDETHQSRVTDALTTVRAKARTRTLRDRSLLGAAAAAVTVGALVVALNGGSDSQTLYPVGPSLTTPSPTPAISASTADALSALRGLWRTAPLTAEQLRGTVEAATLDQWVADVVGELPDGVFTLTLSIQGTGYWTLTLNHEGIDTVLDRESVTMDGHRLVLTPMSAEGKSTYDYAMNTDTSGARQLTLDFIGTTEPDSGEAHQRAFYTTTAFSEAKTP